MHKFQRVFHGDDVLGPGLIDEIDHHGQSGGFAATGCSGDKHQTEALFAQFLENRGKAQLIDRKNGKRDDSANDAVSAALKVDVGAHTAFVANAKGEVHLHRFVEDAQLTIAH